MANPRQYNAKVTIWKNGKIMIDPQEEDKEVVHRVVPRSKKRKN